jgi:UDP-N-acetylmuramyl pentapeptide phosphotransferase/UDP-N-acetylglucosamine-1-phosphate transferase
VNPLAIALPAAVAIAAIALLRRSPFAARVLDRPGERSLHEVATPRIGGIGLMLGALPVAFALGTPEVRLLALAAAALALVSLVDDARPLPVAVRLPCHFAASAVAVAVAWPEGAALDAGTVAGAATAFLAIAWMANLYNFMDGADGLAGGMATIGFGALGLAAFGAGDGEIGNACLATAAAAAGFLAFNFPPARVFLGDAGSVPLGFLAGALGWLGSAKGLWPAWFPLLVFSPFVVDASVTLARRSAGREPILQAHRSHYYQRLVLSGWSHRRLALASWAIMALCAASALFALGKPGGLQGAIIFAWALAYGVLLVRIDRRHPRGQEGSGSRPPGSQR